jgi:hypothetical protein
LYPLPLIYISLFHCTEHRYMLFYLNFNHPSAGYLPPRGL